MSFTTLIRSWWLLPCAGAWSCGAEPPLPAEQLADENAKSAENSVVGLMDERGALYCSGVALAANVVLTAGHCVYEAAALPRWILPEQDARWTQDALIEVEWRRRHPDYRADHPESDLAIVSITTELQSYEHLSRHSLSELITQPDLSRIGFGADGPLDEPSLRQVTRVVPYSVTEELLGTLPSSCVGDSGAPVFASQAGERAVVGVVSGGDWGCRGPSLAVRVDAGAKTSNWVTATLERAKEL